MHSLIRLYPVLDLSKNGEEPIRQGIFHCDLSGIINIFDAFQKFLICLTTWGVQTEGKQSNSKLTEAPYLKYVCI